MIFVKPAWVPCRRRSIRFRTTLSIILGLFIISGILYRASLSIALLPSTSRRLLVPVDPRDIEEPDTLNDDDAFQLDARVIRLSQWICDGDHQIYQGEHVAHHVVLWTNSTLVAERKILNRGFSSYNFDSGKDKCWVYTGLPKFVHPGEPVLASKDLFFGLATKHDRLIVKHSWTSNWLRKSDTNLFVQIPKNDKASAESAIKKYYRSMGLSTYTVKRDDTEEDQTMMYARLSATMLELCKDKKLDHVKWFIHLDDDTLLTSVADYARMLDTYDHTKPLYLGAHSESSSTLWRDGRGAWGGASIAVSRPLAEAISQNWAECVHRMGHTVYGDHKLDACVAYLQGRTPRQPVIQLENSLHQLDFFGSIDGYLRSGVRWLTLHHFGWVNLFPIPDSEGDTVAKVGRIVESARQLGSANLFANYLLKSDDSGATVLTNGYAITQYLVPLTKVELEQVERTYHQQNPGDYEAALGPTREAKEEGVDKKTFWVDRVVERSDALGRRVGSSWVYRHARNGTIEDIVVDWME